MSLRDAHRARKPAIALLLIILACVGCEGRRAEAPLPAFDPDSIPDAYRGSTAALMWPGATRAFQIRPDGDLYNGEWMVRFAPMADGQAAGPPRVIAYEERWRPVAHWRRWSGRVRWDFEALALPGPGARDSGLVVSLLVQVTNTASVPLDASLSVSLTPPEPMPPFVAADPPETAGGALSWGPMSGRDTVHAWSEADPSGGL